MPARRRTRPFLLAWIVTGAEIANLLYPPAFAALTHWGGADRVRTLTALTLVAGLASTVFAPVTAVLEDWFGWRDACLVLAGVLAAITIRRTGSASEHRGSRTTVAT